MLERVLPLSSGLPVSGSTPVNAASFGESNVDYVNTNRIYQFSDNLTKIWGQHTIKAGIYIERNRKLQPGGPTYTGAYNFGKDVNNPLDSGDGFANALLGNYDTYNENSGHFVYDTYYWEREFYIQDDWRVGKRLTLNFGMRFVNMPPQEDQLHEFSYFDPSTQYKSSAVSAIYAIARVATPAQGRIACRSTHLRASCFLPPTSGCSFPIAAIRPMAWWWME